MLIIKFIYNFLYENIVIFSFKLFDFGFLVSDTPSLASRYESGYARYCDVIGGLGITYSPRGNYGSTTYYNRNCGYSRTETYTLYRNDTYYKGGR